MIHHFLSDLEKIQEALRMQPIDEEHTIELI
jgi:hypothetical protein